MTEGEERLEQALLLGLGFEHLLAGRAQRVEREVGVGKGDLEQCAAQGERRAQLVRGVGDELALRLKGRLEPAEQSVEGVAELFQLIVGPLEGETLVQVRSRDRSRCSSHRVQPSAGCGRRPPSREPPKRPP